MPLLTALGFDYGLKNIGVAYGQSLTCSAKALAPLPANDGVPKWPEVEKLLQQWQPDILIVGLPLNMDDSEGELCQRARKFGRRLKGRFNIPIEWVDERLSSVEAKAQAKILGHKGNYKQNPIDSIAACLILETWLRSVV